MSAIKSLCVRIDKTFFEVLTHSVQAASYLLADLYCFRVVAKGEEKVRLCATLCKLKKQLKPHHVAALWQAISGIDPIDWGVLSKGTRQSLTLLKKVMLRQKIYLQVLDTATLLQLGKNPRWYREVLIALIRKHLWLNKLTDPFIYPKFSYHLVSTGGAEQNFLYVSGFIAKCASLPVPDLISLGSHQSVIAELLLKDLNNSLGYFQVSAAYARLHAVLRAKIAKDWQHYLEIYPLNSKDQCFLHQELPILQKAYPEFRAVVFDNRSTRHYQAPTAVKPCAADTSQRPLSIVMMLPAPIAFLLYVFRRLEASTKGCDNQEYSKPKRSFK